MSNEADRIESVLASAPQNATAAKVMGSGAHYDPNLSKYSQKIYTEPPPVRPIPPESLYSCADLPGKKFGRFTVVGLAAEWNPKKNALWVCRCQCGRYAKRRALSIRKENPEDCCTECKHLSIIQRQYKSKGSRPFSDFHPDAPNDGGNT